MKMPSPFLREQATRSLRFHDAFDADSHRCHAVRNFVRLGASDDLGEGMLHDAEEFVGHFCFAPHESLQTLHPFEIGDDDTARVAQDVGNDEKFGPALIENLVRFWRRWAIGALSENTAL